MYFKLGKSLSMTGRNQEALDAVNQALAINGMYEPALMLAGQLKMARGNFKEARQDFERLIDANRKYFSAYVELAKILVTEGRQEEARETLRSCLRINPRYRPAIIALGDTFKGSDPEIAGKYYNLANSMTTFN